MQVFPDNTFVQNASVYKQIEMEAAGSLLYTGMYEEEFSIKMVTI